MSSLQPPINHHFATSNFWVHWPISTRSRKMSTRWFSSYVLQNTNSLQEEGRQSNVPQQKVLHSLVLAANLSNLAQLTFNDSTGCLLAFLQLGDKCWIWGFFEKRYFAGKKLQEILVRNLGQCWTEVTENVAALLVLLTTCLLTL